MPFFDDLAEPDDAPVAAPVAAPFVAFSWLPPALWSCLGFLAHEFGGHGLRGEWDAEK